RSRTSPPSAAGTISRSYRRTWRPRGHSVRSRIRTEGEKMAQEYIEARGARENNLKDVSLQLPKRKITIFTGVSGSGKSSLAFGSMAQTTVPTKRLIMKRSIVFLGLLAVAGASVPAGAADVEVVASFEGNKGPGWKAAANVMGAVGPRHVVDFSVAGFTVHDKATGKVLRHLSQRA